MKINNLVRFLLVFCLAFLSYNISAAESPVVSHHKIQKEMSKYFKVYHNKEKFTAIAVSVFIPQEKNKDALDVATFVKGTMGYPPLSQEITPLNLFDIGSITKSFASLILLQLQTEGKLSLDDPLGKWLPQYKEWKDVTLRQLLNMTSGIPNYSEDPEFAKKMEENLAAIWSDEELLGYAHPEKPIETNRENRYEYSNSNYILAGMVIEKVTQDTFENQLKQRIINPNNGLNNSFYPAGPHGTEVEKSIRDRRVHGYFYDEDNEKLIDTITNDLSWAGAAGAIVANTEDVGRWVQLLYHGLLIEPDFRDEVLSELKSVVSIKSGLPIPTVTEEDPSGFGLGVGYYYDKNSRQRFWTYQGSTLGYRVMYLWNPCNNVTVVVALNGKGGSGNEKSKMGNHIHELCLKIDKVIAKNYPYLRCTS
ncbi:TPA: beta-lactamase family protein [Legionella pneumophila]|nr:serine hydrolase domain-containing protein [Legionella pneumophila]HAT2048676.1 beta-lactamase family protein [Legionella pneumophila]HAT4008464.1 beta-lactamase family protein [Legionella pneumophila]HAT6363650.1 beta-lactamase family protein [Legionella pneumophila]HAT6370277.1 beta-lactamase family protein [Legionella pneumophila]HAT7806899.1 serine hydrolase [Legionella pneumophila]